MKALIPVLLVAAVLLARFTTSADAVTQNVEAELIRPFGIIGIKTDASDAERRAAETIKTALGVSVVTGMKSNPTCAVWIEISNWTPNPGTPGYFIINQPGGSVISAADEEQLKLAVERFLKSIKVVDGESRVPVGLMTNYRVVPE